MSSKPLQNFIYGVYKSVLGFNRAITSQTSSISAQEPNYFPQQLCMQKWAILWGKNFSTRNISGRLFYRKRPRMIPRYKPKNPRSCWLEGCPQKKGVVVSVGVVTPKKPNSGKRKIARVRLSTGRTVTCHIPGQDHNLHTHSVVLVRGGRCQDVTGCHYKVIRGKYDLLPVKNRMSSRSKYGAKLTDAMREKRTLRKLETHITTDLDREIFNTLGMQSWINPDGTTRQEPIGPQEPIPFDIFNFNTRWRSILHYKKQQQG